MGDYGEIAAALGGLLLVAAVHAKLLVPAVLERASKLFLTRREFELYRNEHDSRHLIQVKGRPRR